MKIHKIAFQFTAGRVFLYPVTGTSGMAERNGSSKDTPIEWHVRRQKMSPAGENKPAGKLNGPVTRGGGVNNGSGEYKKRDSRFHVSP